MAQRKISDSKLRSLAQTGHQRVKFSSLNDFNLKISILSTFQLKQQTLQKITKIDWICPRSCSFFSGNKFLKHSPKKDKKVAGSSPVTLKLGAGLPHWLQKGTKQ